MVKNKLNKLVIIGNGFDLAHGLPTGYCDFISWYFRDAYKQFCKSGHFNDPLFELYNSQPGMKYSYPNSVESYQEIINRIESESFSRINYNSVFFNKMMEQFESDSWVDIERYYFQTLKAYFKNQSGVGRAAVINLNQEFDFIISQLIEYIKQVNKALIEVPKLQANQKSNFDSIFINANKEVKVLNFNYTETIYEKKYLDADDIINIHGRVHENDINPIVFGYGDESDPEYQNIEDSGDNIYLEHIKSFAYFKTDNYEKLLSFIDAEPFQIIIVGHSCGLSDRVLLNEIFEHENCRQIEIFYHRHPNGNDNFKEITQEISRHFKPQNKNMMRRKILGKNLGNIIPQNPDKITILDTHSTAKQKRKK